jgi:hypothetical protein
MEPESGDSTPVKTLIRVDLPAPFSPIKAWTSPFFKEKSTFSRARTPGKDFVMPLIFRIFWGSAIAHVPIFYIRVSDDFFGGEAALI